MNHLDFDDLFRHKLDKAGQHITPSDVEWSGLYERLAARKRMLKWTRLAFLAALILALLAGNIYWLMQLNKLQTGTLNTNNGKIGLKKEVIVDQFDTIIRHTTVVVYDTVYQTVYLQKPSSMRVISSQDALLGNTNAAFQFAKKEAKGNKVVVDSALNSGIRVDEKAFPSNVSMANTATLPDFISKNAESGNADFNTATYLPALPLDLLKVPKRSINFEMKFQHAMPTKINRHLPFDVSVGLVAGTSSFASRNLHQRGGFYVGARTEVSVWKRWDLVAELGSQQMIGLQSGTLNTLPFDTKAPEVAPNLVFKEWEIQRLPSINYQLGAKYRLLNTAKKWSPYLTAGYYGARLGTFKTNFEYRDESNTPTFVSKAANRRQQDVYGGIYGGIGGEFQLKSHINLMIEASSNRPLDRQHHAGLPTQINLKLGALYRF